MMPRSLLPIAAVVMFALAGPVSGQSPPSDLELVRSLRAGGNVIVIRHGATDPDMADTDPLNHDNIAKQRQLSAKGEAAAVALGEAFKSIGIPVGQVYTSRFNRAYQTAKLAGFEPIEKSIDLTEGGLVVSPNENNRRAQALRKLAATLPPAASNVVIITHKPNILDAFGKDWFEVKEGEATIFKPDGGGYTLVARVQMADWSRLAKAAKN
jgi:broad specificity phosphatase PhoE